MGWGLGNNGKRNIAFSAPWRTKYLTKSNFIFSCSAPTNRHERAMKKHMLKYLSAATQWSLLWEYAWEAQPRGLW